MLLDAGEGSLGQMWRLFGSEGGDKEDGEGMTGILKGLQVIWISHPHAVSDDATPLRTSKAPKQQHNILV